MDGIELFKTIANILLIIVPLTYSIVSTLVNIIKTKNWNKLVELIYQWVVEAEQNYTAGADKKAWVMSMIKSTCKTMKIEFDENKFSSMIDSIVDITKQVNVK